MRSWSSGVADELVVINTGPLILLEKANALDLMPKLPFRFVCPSAVYAELEAGATRGYLIPTLSWLSVLPLAAPLSAIARATLDQGEAEVIQLALERNIRRVCLDDLRGRRIAIASGLQVTGVLGLLALAKTAGVIPLMKPYCDQLLKSGAWYAPELVQPRASWGWGVTIPRQAKIQAVIR